MDQQGGVADTPRGGRAFAPLGIVPFRRLALGRFVNFFGNAFAPVALGFAVLDATGSVSSLGLVVGARTVMNVVFVLFGGVLADRLPRQLVLVGSCTLSALSQGTVATLVLTHHASLPALVLLSGFNGVVAAFAMPASAALTPQTVPPELTTQANAVMRLGGNAAMILGAAGAGIVVSAVGPGWGLTVDAVCFAAAGGFFAVVRVPAARRPAEAAESPLADLRDGWTEFRSRSWVWVVVVAFMLLNAVFSAAVQVLGPAIADDTFGRRAWGFVIAAQTGGMIVGALLAMRVRPRRLLFFGCACMAAQLPFLIALGAWPVVPVLLVAAFVDGLGTEQFGIAWEVSLQQHIPADKLARVYSYDMLGSFVAIPVGQLTAGPLAQAVGTERTLLGGAALSGIVVALMCATRSVRRLRTAAPGKDGEPAAVPEPAPA